MFSKNRKKDIGVLHVLFFVMQMGVTILSIVAKKVLQWMITI